MATKGVAMNISHYAKTPWPLYMDNPPRYTPYFWFEKFDVYYWKQLMLDYPNVPWYACAIYLCVIFGLQSYMKDRPPIKARKIMIAWNTGLAIFSAFGFYRIGQELWDNLQKPDGYYKSVCVREGRNQPAEVWGLLFTLSKFVELGDTVFIVLRKQPLLALQWYHHCLVTVFGWKLYPWSEPIIAYFSSINFGVHMFMYAYFAIRGLNIRVPEPLAMSITTMQILQMVVNTVNNGYTMFMLGTGQPCSRHPTSIKWSTGVYVSLWILFAKFFFDRYYAKKRVKKID